MSIIVAVLALGFLVFFHELGHFAAAKLFGVGVLEFSIGMGPRLLSRVWRNTRYSLKLFPFGGSCAMLGEDNAGSGDFSTPEGTEEEEDSSVLDYEGVKYRKEEMSSYSFQNKPAWQRFIICLAGVFNNLLLALVLSAVIVGFTGFDNPYIAVTTEEAPVHSADLRQGDLLKQIDLDGKERRQVGSFRELYIWLYMNTDSMTENSEIHVTVERQGTLLQKTFHPYYDSTAGKYRLGINFYSGRFQPENARQFMQDVLQEMKYNVTIVLDSFRMILRGKVHRNEVMGPVGTVSVIGDTVEKSAQYGVFNAFLVLLELMIMISANLAVMNLLPIPALDGGRLLFLLVEMLTRQKLAPSVEERVNRIGMALLLALMVLVMGNDILNLLTGAYAGLN